MAYTGQIIGGMIPEKYPMAMYDAFGGAILVYNDSEYEEATKKGYMEDVDKFGTIDHIKDKIVEWQRNIVEAVERLRGLGVVDTSDFDNDLDDESGSDQVLELQARIKDLEIELTKAKLLANTQQNIGMSEVEHKRPGRKKAE